MPPELYDERYYLGACAGHEEWAASQGAEAHPLYLGSLRIARLRPGETLVDLGSGRGELLAVAVSEGAARAVGVEYSADAVSLAARTLEARGAGERAQVIHGDVRDVPLPGASADLVTLLDVVEHLAPSELDDTLAEAHRLLRPGGRLLVHTFPNRLVYDVTYRLLRRLWRSWPADPRLPYEHAMHVNEQSGRGLRRALRRAGFVDVRVEHGRMLHLGVFPSHRVRRVLAALASRPATAPLAAADIWGHARKAGA